MAHSDSVYTRELRLAQTIAVEQVSNLTLTPKIAGGRTLYYWIVTIDEAGNKSAPSGVFDIKNAPDVLSINNYVTIQWMPVSGAYSYDILRSDLPFAPSGVSNNAVATGVRVTSLVDKSEVLNAYTVIDTDGDIAETNEFGQLTFRRNGIPIRIAPFGKAAEAHKFFTAYDEITHLFSNDVVNITDVVGLETIINNLIDTRLVDVGITYNGKPAASTVLVRHPFPFVANIPENCAGSILFAETPATSNCTFSILKNGGLIGMALIAAGATNAVFTCPATVFAIGDILKIVSPAVIDATLADLGGSIYGTR